MSASTAWIISVIKQSGFATLLRPCRRPPPHHPDRPHRPVPRRLCRCRSAGRRNATTTTHAASASSASPTALRWPSRSARGPLHRDPLRSATARQITRSAPTARATASAAQPTTTIRASTASTHGTTTGTSASTASRAPSSPRPASHRHPRAPRRRLSPPRDRLGPPCRPGRPLSLRFPPRARRRPRGRPSRPRRRQRPRAVSINRTVACSGLTAEVPSRAPLCRSVPTVVIFPRGVPIALSRATHALPRRPFRRRACRRRRRRRPCHPVAHKIAMRAWGAACAFASSPPPSAPSA